MPRQKTIGKKKYKIEDRASEERIERKDTEEQRVTEEEKERGRLEEGKGGVTRFNAV